MLNWLAGKKTYIVVAIGVLVNGAYAMGLLDDKQVIVIDGFLGLLGLGTIRAGIARAGNSGFLFLALLLLPGCATYAAIKGNDGMTPEQVAAWDKAGKD